MDFDPDIDRPLFLKRRRRPYQFRVLLAIVVGSFSTVAVLFFGLGYLIAK
jgi:hypothetical protein